MKNTFTPYIIQVLFLVSCTRVSEPLIEKNTAIMNYPFKFRENHIENFEYNSGDTTISVTSEDSLFIEKKILIGQNFHWSSAYNKKTLQIVSKSQSFLEAPIYSKAYDRMGNLIKSKDYGTGFNISVSNLITKLKLEKKLNINDSSTLSLQRIDQNSILKNPKYQVVYSINSEDRYIIVDGKTGEILKEDIIRIIE